MPGKQPYHHADLKQTLLDAAVALIAEVGPQAFTLREVARRAGVSHNAPYRHFQDKDDLLAAVAAQGFDRLTESMLRAMKKGQGASERLRLAGRGYVQFALHWPQHIRVMFDGPRPQEERPEYAAAGSRAFQTLLDAIIAVQTEGELPQGDPQTYAIASWSAMHGLAKLAVGGQLPFNARRTLEVADYLTAVLARGMASAPSDAPQRG
ncbi:MAG TPA: TetR/AcrR family transcriptional regulator [Bryobacteraceae bacterium]|nr:TetR/AcrR family transcriptional regulator [Bryobacteraceae bacterium]